MLRSLRFRKLNRFQRLTAIGVIGTACTLLAIAISLLPPFSAAVERIDIAMYDAFYRQRGSVDVSAGPVVIVAVDQGSIDAMSKEENRYRWPWPRVYWGAVLDYLQRSGASVVAVDLLFEEPSGYNNEADDDKDFAARLDQLTLPVIHSVRASKATTRPAFAPRGAKEPVLGAVNVIEEAVVRRYVPFVDDTPSLAVQAIRAAGKELSGWAHEPFLLHYYGPNKRPDGGRTFHYLAAYDVLGLMRRNEIRPDLFGGKIVLIGATADATFDLKASPLSNFYPGVEAHATALQNLLDNRHVTTLGIPTRFMLGWLAALIAATGALLPRKAILKLLTSVASLVILFLVGYALFTGSDQIYWLPMSGPLLAAGSATVVGLAWTYLVEDRRRRVLLRFLAQYVSPAVADELSRRGEISLGGVRRMMTVMFTDIEGFSDLSEHMPVEQVESFMNLYLSEMSQVIFALDGTLDKYIGDAIMSFWNAPLDQPEHAAMACRAAIAMRDRERAIRPRLAEIGADGIRTRIGINTGPMVVGNLGSEQKVNYTVLGDAVNLASRIEGANKIYGSQILVAEPTVVQVRERFLFRKLDLLRVKGRKQPMAVYELLSESPGDERHRELARQYEEALAKYQQKDWATAEQILIALLARFPDDAPVSVLLRRVRAFRKDPPPENWDGVYGAENK